MLFSSLVQSPEKDVSLAYSAEQGLAYESCCTDFYITRWARLIHTYPYNTFDLNVVIIFYISNIIFITILYHCIHFVIQWNLGLRVWFVSEPCLSSKVLVSQSKFQKLLTQSWSHDVWRQERLVLQDRAPLSIDNLLGMFDHLAEHLQSMLLAVQGFTVKLFSGGTFKRLLL